MKSPDSDSKSKSHRGLLIAFEGIDGSGKTTMARRTAEALSNAGHHAVYLREPTDGEHGRKLRELMVATGPRDVHDEFRLFLLDRRQDVEDNIMPVLNAGGIVCIDRYYISSMAYQGALGLDPNEIQRANEEFAPTPDVILFFKVPVETALQRINTDRKDGPNTFERKENLHRVAEIFDNMAFPQSIDIDATTEQDTVFAAVMAALQPFVKQLA